MKAIREVVCPKARGRASVGGTVFGGKASLRRRYVSQVLKTEKKHLEVKDLGRWKSKGQGSDTFVENKKEPEVARA